MKTNNHQRLTGISDMDLFFLQVDFAKIYLNEVMGCDQWMTDQICHSSVFWKWWVNQWNMRDEEFTLALSNNYHTNKELYTSYHNPLNLEVYPHTVVLRQAYESMMHDLVKSEVRNG